MEIHTKADIPCQKRTFVIYKPFINCQNCLRNLNPEQCQYGRRIKDYCQFFKKELPLPKKDATDEELLAWNRDNQERAQKCDYWTPSSMHIAADLSDQSLDYEVDGPENLSIEADSEYAAQLKILFTGGQL